MRRLEKWLANQVETGGPPNPYEVHEVEVFWRYVFPNKFSESFELIPCSNKIINVNNRTLLKVACEFVQLLYVI